MKKTSVLAIIVILIAILAVGTYLRQRTSTVTYSGPLKGVSLSPKSYEQPDFTKFFEEARQAGNVVSWSGDWIELGNNENGGPKVLTELAAAYGYTPIVIAQFFTQSTGQLLRPLDDATKQTYKNYAAAFAARYKPKYIGFGIEVNVLYEKSPADYAAFVAFFPEVYDAVKAASPDTKVFVVFQLEKMKGLSGGLFGGVNDPNNAQWALLDNFSTSDIIAFTTYPGLIYNDPSAMPENYYTEIKSRTAKAVAFTEIGWHSAASPVGWESSEAEQSEFVVKFFTLTKDLNKELAIWSFLYDQNTLAPFNSMGLRRSDGTARQAWGSWINAA